MKHEFTSLRSAPRLTPMTTLAVGLLITLSGCGSSSNGGGACENSGASAYELCNENIDESHCNMLSPAKWEPGQTCNELGYTMPCSSGHQCYCKPGDPYCP
jgi:hypothetical protein